MKVLYRPHRGGLNESMEELKEFDTVEGLLNYLCELFNFIYGRQFFSLKNFNFSYYCYDDRIDWQTYIVSLYTFCEEDSFEEFHKSQAIGFMTFKY